MAALAALARGIGRLLGLLARWLDGLRVPARRPIQVRPIAGASDGTEEASPNGSARRPSRRTGGRATATNGRAHRRDAAGEAPRGSVGAASDADAGAATAAAGAPDGAKAADAEAVGAKAVEPEADEATVEPLREAARRSLVPRWLAARRTAFFNALAALGLLLFGGLTALVGLGLTADADLAMTTAIQTTQLPLFGGLMTLASVPGFPPYSFMLVGGAAALLVLAGLRTEAGFTLLAGASAVVTALVKAIIARPRPTSELVRVESIIGGHSFPSGHTLFYVTFFGFLGYLAYALLKPGRLRTVLLWACGLLMLLVGPSRIWLGHHWASDVLASYALGLAYLVVLVQAYARVRLRREAQPA